MNADPFDAIRALVVNKVKVVMSAIGAETRDDVKKSINTPWPPASAEFSPPHRRTGRLHNGVTHAQELLPDRIREVIQSERVPGDPRVPRFLTEGTPNMKPRPYMEPARDRAEKTVLGNVAGKLKF